MGTEHDKAEDYGIVSLNWRLHFQDRAPDDPSVGPARIVDIAGRCTDCWGSVVASVDGDGRWIRIECGTCDQRVGAEDAEREVQRMRLEADRNMPKVRVGGAPEYDQKARFVLKILPDMDRDKAEFEQRVDDAKGRAQPKQQGGRQLTRRRFAKGTPGYLYLQACALVSGLDFMPQEVSAISLSDFDFENPEIDIHGPKVDELGRVQVSAEIPRRPSSSRRTMKKMGTRIIAGFAAAFACEVGMKAILMTRLDRYDTTHDLLNLYKSLPEDCQERLQGDFTRIAEVLEKYRYVFHAEGRYFEPSANDAEEAQSAAILALVDEDRIWWLRRAARVIVDEGVVAGLQYEIALRYDVDVQARAHVNNDLEFTIVPDDASAFTKVSMRIDVHEAAIPWDEILSL